MMMNYTSCILFIALNFLYVVNINRLLLLVDGSRPSYRHTSILVLTGTLIVASGLSGYFRFTDDMPTAASLSILLTYILIFLIIFLMHNNKCGALYVTSVFMCLDSIVQSMCGIFIEFFWTSDMIGIITKAASLLINLIFFLVSGSLIKKTETVLPFTARLIPKKVHALVLSMLMLLGEMCGCIQSKFANEALQNNIILVSTLIIIPLLFMMIVYLINNCISRQYYELMSDIMEENVNEQVSYYKKMATMSNELRKFRHDYKNHLTCINMLIDSGKYAKASQYIQDVTNQEIISSKTYSSGNYIADSILDRKNENAQANNAEIVFNGAIDNSVPLAKLSTILFNALDNAVEACGRIDSAEKLIIDVKCAVNRNLQIISIANPMPEKSRFDKTSKSDKKNHGFGLINIRKAVTDLNGQMKIDAENGTFALTVEFPLTPSSEPVM